MSEKLPEDEVSVGKVVFWTVVVIVLLWLQVHGYLLAPAAQPG